ncbi:hypothetical protein SAMN02745244_01142 [Tessaracoccus bendigoensis DSM 12906]|uniref:Fibronectin type-III domain-containing protein n=1 Tax=Tessaracoccus bendigoensis DSM 12906 TaxID=1123357 RepID=A0A1M6E9N0_9ACTN|nr:hypothetical protein [Tessaracoccus bendigoensis]SHI82217.1 hypothetical protein SAMN02745244_01142 [Tessaracoccus bendigoensis DSM 12906]
MSGFKTQLSRLTRLPWCCRPPAAPSGLTATPGGGSAEVQVTWDPLAASASVAHYRVYRRKTTGQFDLLAVVTADALGLLEPGRLGVVDAPDYWPWPSGGDPSAERCYAVSAVSTRGLEGPMSGLACALPL